MKSEYIYKFENQLLKVTRQDNHDKPKTFFQEHSQDDGKTWKTGSGGLLVEPYKYEDWKDHDLIYFVEGEKCAEAIIKKGLCATTIPGGANGWKPHYSQFFIGKNVVILPDNDEPGKKFAQSVFNGIQYHAQALKIVELPDLKLKEDVFDFLALRVLLGKKYHYFRQNIV